MRKLWIDDVRKPPDSSWHWAQTLDLALSAIRRYDWDHISFDHDLGGADTTQPVANFLRTMAWIGVGMPFQWEVHSQNPVGSLVLKATLSETDELWEQHIAKRKRVDAETTD